MATHQRPELAASQDQIAAAWERVRKAEQGPLLPKIQVADQVGSFGGGLDADLQDFKGRNTFSAMLYWEVRNFGYGNAAETRERRAGVDRAVFQSAEVQARVAAEVVEAAEIAIAKSESLNWARDAVSEATELYRISHEGTFNVLDAKNLFDALRPLQALQFLNQARQNYIGAVMDYNRAQYRLNAALGRPTECLEVDQP
jgi:outer membrane protein TolC